MPPPPTTSNLLTPTAMLNIRRILFSTDHSACAERAFTHAAYLADRYDAELHVLHVTEPEGAFLDECFDDIRITPEDIAADLDLPLPERADRRADEPVALTESEEPGPDPAPVILSYAEGHDVDLIVMGTHGRRGLRHLVIGSVAEEVVRLAPCPVFTLRTPEDGDGIGAWTIRRVLTPVDFSERSCLAARHAAALAAAYDAELDLVFVVDVPAVTPAMPFDGAGIDPEDLRRPAEETLAGFAETLQDETPALRDRVTTHIRVGHPVREILDVVEQTGTDLLVLGSHGRTGFRRFLLGSVAEQLVRLAPCPVFTLKSFGKSLLQPQPETAEEADHARSRPAMV